MMYEKTYYRNTSKFFNFNFTLFFSESYNIVRFYSNAVEKELENVLTIEIN